MHMGFFGALGKIIQGKPVFEPGQPPSNNTQQPLGQQSRMPQQPGGPKQMPHVEVERVVCHMSGAHMDCDAFIQNNSQDTVDLDRLHLMGTTSDLGRTLRPGEEHEFRIYSGNRPNNTSYSQAELTVKDHTGDYFQLMYHVEFKAVGDGTYVIDRIRSQQTRDI
jgi:hypothetical protein